MPAAEADIRTGHAASYLARLCGHAAKMGQAGHGLPHRPRAHDRDGRPPEVRRVERSGTEATVSLDRGQWTMRALPGRLAVRAEAADQEDLRRIQDLLTTRLEKFGQREHLTVTWRTATAEARTTAGPEDHQSERAGSPAPFAATRPPGPRGAEAARTLARIVTGRPLEACAALFAQYGDTVYLPVRPWPGLYILSRPEQAEHVLAASQDNYVKPFTYRPLRVLLGDGLLTAEETTWRRHRRIIQPAFSGRNVAAFAADMDAAARCAVRRWDGSPVVDVASEMSALALDVAGRALFGTDRPAQDPSLGRALAAGQRLALLGALLPLPWGPVSTRAPQAVARRFGAGTAQQVERLISGPPEPDADGRRDLLGLLTTARDADGRGLSEQEIRDEISTFLVAGYETTAMALTWSLALLSAYPRARQRLENEADSVLGDGPADQSQLPWTSAVVSEAMRLYPPAWTLERTAVADDDVCGTPVPRGSMVAVLPYLVHRNPAVWPNPSGFDPGRFLPGAPERHRYAWIPFGGGRRGCVGAGFARQEAVLVLARLCRHYRLDLTTPGLPRPRGLVTLRPSGPVLMRLTRRS